ncbi:MAG: hypothetical protein CBC78_000260 [Candidatus Pelagibacter sp. TMED118]|nr:MAG: hypothetical protein CBC78_000260 [Candidatus Pelagibacter sp. TMED118]
MRLQLILFFFILFNINSLASNKDYFLMLKNSTVNVRYGPSFEYPIKFIYKKKFLPLKIIDKKENFRKIIDHKNNSGWIHISQLQKGMSLITLKDSNIFKKASKFSKPIVKVKKGRLLLIEKCEKDWCKIKTGSYSGWVEVKKLWGRDIN